MKLPTTLRPTIPTPPTISRCQCACRRTRSSIGTCGRVSTFTRLIAHWAEYADADYLKFVEDAKPEICQIGFYGGHFYSLAHTPQFSGYPAHFPVQGTRWSAAAGSSNAMPTFTNAAPRSSGISMSTFLVGEPDGKDGPRGFFKFYKELWDEKELGPEAGGRPARLCWRRTPTARRWPRRLTASANARIHRLPEQPALAGRAEGLGQSAASNAAWTATSSTISTVTTACANTVRPAFAIIWRERFTPEQIRERFQIADLKSHKFTELVGWHDPKESTPLRREMLRWSQISLQAGVR